MHTDKQVGRGPVGGVRPAAAERLLLVDSDPVVRRSLSKRLGKRRWTVRSAAGEDQALRLIGAECFDVIVVDPFTSDGAGRTFLEKLRACSPGAEVIVLTADTTAAQEDAAFACGAFDVLRKPCRFGRLQAAVERAAEHVRLRRESAALRWMTEVEARATEIVGESRAAAALRTRVERLSAAHGAVLIEGERGTGKERVARAIWAAGPRRDRPFLLLSTTGKAGDVLTDELFGHEQGAFDGATSDREGLLEAAHGMTVFVEEIGELDLAAQTELLRVIERGELRRVGATQLRRLDVRVLAATARDLERETREGRFSRDLFYRLGALRVVVPPLRDRLEDIPVLVERQLKGMHRSDEPTKEMSRAAVKLLKGYDWPGNDRELVCVVERVVMCSKAPVITVEEVGSQLGTGPPPELTTLQEMERRHVARVLRHVSGNKSEAARLLGIGRRKLYHLMERLALDDEDDG